jgi:hypothetical protein
VAVSSISFGTIWFGIIPQLLPAMGMLKLQALASFDPQDQSLETFKTERENEDQVHQITGTWQ